MNILTNSISLDAGRVASVQNESNLFCERLNTVEVNSDVFEFLELVRELMIAPEKDRRAVAAWCALEINNLENQLEADNRPDESVCAAIVAKCDAGLREYDACIEGQRADGN